MCSLELFISVVTHQPAGRISQEEWAVFCIRTCRILSGWALEQTLDTPG